MEKELTAYTLSVYEYVVKEDRPVGTRDVMRGVNLSSPSVASRHLQKLESMGLLEKNKVGDYVLKEKIGVNSQVWVGKTLLPRLMLYSFFFLGALSAEVGIIVLSFINTEIVIGIPFLSLTGITAVAMFLFFIEGLIFGRKLRKQTN
jgi:DNA-binding transcriptional ArsR family regulator